jgi:penicillin-binding protein 2
MMAIGQSDCATTPLQMAAIVSAIANGGKYYKPRIVKRVIHPHQGALINNTPKLKVDLLKEGLKAADLEHIRHGMWLAANKLGGTARRAAVKDRDVSAKTGTAQVVDQGLVAHEAWTVAFAPYDHPRYVVVVAVHRGEHGGTVAGPLVHLIFRGLFAQEDGIKLPIVKMTESQGDFEVREAVTLPEEDDFIDIAYENLAALEEEANTGETGNEISEIPTTQPPLIQPDPHIPKPSIKQKADAEGSKIPKAIIIEE